MGRQIAHIILTGKLALEEVFLDLVSDIVSDVFLEAVALPFTETSELLAVKGASEMTRRKLICMPSRTKPAQRNADSACDRTLGNTPLLEG